jgi:hypothetical protein
MQKNSYIPYQYPPMYPYSMPDLNFANSNPLHFRMPPPPGGIDYLFHDYSHYSAHNLDAYHKFHTEKDRTSFH